MEGPPALTSARHLTDAIKEGVFEQLARLRSHLRVGMDAQLHKPSQLIIQYLGEALGRDAT